MAETARKDMRVTGTSRSSGGAYRRVAITGECVLAGNVDCVALSGTGEIAVEGDLRAGEIGLTGNCAVKGKLQVGRLRGRGGLRAESELRGEALKFTGNVEAGGNCETGSFRLHGAFAVDGLLSADRLEARMFGPCRAREIGGGFISVKRSLSAGVVKTFSRQAAPMLSAELVEGDTVELQHAHVAVVRGRDVTVGAGCEIGRVEYRGKLNVHKRARIGEIVRLDPR